MKAGGLVAPSQVVRCTCGAWNIRGRACPACADLADKLLTAGAWASVAVLYLAMTFLFLMWWAPTR